MNQGNARRAIGHQLLGLQIGAGALDSLVDRAITAVADRTSYMKFACANPHSLVAAQNDPDFMSALRCCEATVADGIGVTLIARLTGVRVGPRITGHEFFSTLMSRLNQRGGTAFFLGSRDTVLRLIAARAARDYPKVKVEYLSPPFGNWSDEVNAEIVATIRAANPDVLWVGMTAPKQEKWVQGNAAELQVPVIGSIGAVFDYYAGTVRRAPTIFCRLGLEWLYRLALEPARLWRRTLVSMPVFVALALGEHARLLISGQR
jgi:N-acetylglucosaminyldiphosphoundecaprenol N-acetyl-beta-D-mannosaminyltransferase